MDYSLLLCRSCLYNSWLHLTDISGRLNCHMDSMLQIHRQEHVTVMSFQCCLGLSQLWLQWLADCAEVQC